MPRVDETYSANYHCKMKQLISADAFYKLVVAVVSSHLHIFFIKKLLTAFQILTTHMLTSGICTKTKSQKDRMFQVV